jgi:ATP-dependent DNA ligase
VLTGQFPDLVRIRETLKRPVLTDGEIMAVDNAGTPLKFQKLRR